MATVIVIGPHPFFFYSNEYGEPPHVHVQPDVARAKFWLTPVSLARSLDFAAQELGRVARLVSDNRSLFEERWNEHFGN